MRDKNFNKKNVWINFLNETTDVSSMLNDVLMYECTSFYMLLRHSVCNK